MKQFIILATFLFHVAGIFAQDKKLEKIEQQFNGKEYLKCIETATKYTEENPKQPESFFYVAFSNFEIYKTSTDKKRDKNLREAIKFVQRGKNKDKTGEIRNKFATQIKEIQDTTYTIGSNIYASGDKEKSKYYFEQLATVFTDTTTQYREMFMPQTLYKVKSLNTFNGPVNQTDAKGMKQGFWTKPYQNGKTAYEATFKDNKPVGLYKRYHTNGKLMAEINYDQNGEHGKTTLYYDDGSLAARGFYNGQIKDSIWLYILKDTMPAMQESYKDGVKHGKMFKFYPDGRIAEERNFNNGIEDGVWRQYYPNGKVCFECKIVKGVRQGGYIKYYETGLVSLSGKYKDDLPDGKWTYFDEKGKKTEVEYKNGKAANEEEIIQKEQEWFKKLDSERSKLIDPEQYRNNPEEFFQLNNSRP